MNLVDLRNETDHRGFVMSELIVAMAISVAAMVGIAQLMYQVTRQYRAAVQRTVVAGEAANVMEDLVSRPWNEITAGNPPALTLSAACRQAAPDARLNVDILPVEAEHAFRIVVRIGWPADDVPQKRPVQLVAWRYEP